MLDVLLFNEGHYYMFRREQKGLDMKNLLRKTYCIILDTLLSALVNHSAVSLSSYSFNGSVFLGLWRVW